MAKPICIALDRAGCKQSRICDAGCKHYRFDHLDTACVLSEVYSVRKNQPCYIYEMKIKEANNG
jgi:hypothetical protein